MNQIYIEVVLENTNNPLCQVSEVSKSNIDNLPSSNDVNCMQNQLTSKPNTFPDQEDMNNKKCKNKDKINDITSLI